MLPDSPTLTALLSAATRGPWRTAHHGTHEVEAVPNQRIADCGTVGSAEADARLMALARPLAEEVVRLRKENVQLRENLAYRKRAENALGWELSEAKEKLERIEGEKSELQQRISLALEILDDPADPVEGICRATEALWGEKPAVPAQVGDAK